jgi:Protein of unknown function (DUF3800)
MIALRAYLDSSGKLEDEYITLAAMAANDGMWDEFEVVWANILDGHTPKGSYIHMREVYRLIKGFDSTLGWNHDRAFGLANKCLAYMSGLDKKRFRMFYCTIDLKAWHKLRAETYQMPESVDMCNRFCSESVIGWYLLHYPDVINPETDTIKYFFDRDEYFKTPFANKWNSEKVRAEKTGAWSPWRVIDEVASVDMKKVPGIQAADIIAWGMNRETFAKDGDAAKYLGHIIRQVIPAFHIVWDEPKMREHFKPLLYT